MQRDIKQISQDDYSNDKQSLFDFLCRDLKNQFSQLSIQIQYETQKITRQEPYKNIMDLRSYSNSQKTLNGQYLNQNQKQEKYHMLIKEKIQLQKTQLISKNYKKNQKKKKKQSSFKPKQNLSKGYSTKNFLPNFKNSHLEYVIQNVGGQIFQNDLFLKIYQKVGISLKDYQKLYKMDELKEVWQHYFTTKRIYRDMMMSKMSPVTRQISLKYIYVFEKWFRSGVCDKMHYQ